MASGNGYNNNHTKEDTSYDSYLLAFKVLNIIEVVVTAWVLLSLILYGTKTRRWRKTAGSSSLNSGIIYTTCTIAVALFLPRLVIVQILVTPKPTLSDDWCDVVCIVGNVASAVSTYASYFFLWLLQRVIYSHPYVKQRLSKWSNWIIYIALLVLTVVAATLCAFYVFPHNYENSTYGCRYRSKNEPNFWKTSGKNLILAAALVIAQLLVLGLSIYPVARVKFDSSQNLGDEANRSFSKDPEKHSRPNWCQQFCMHLCGRDGPKSPIEMVARRAMICSIVMVASDVIALIPAALVFGQKAPVPLRDGIFNIGSFVNIFCMVASFGFAGRILTLLIPTCRKPERSKSCARNGNLTDGV